MILEENNYREKLSKASRIIKENVSTTYGQKGGNVLISRGSFPPFTTKDGYTVAEHTMYPEDDAVNNIIKVIFETASIAVTEAGDGTTTSIVLADAIIQRALTKIDKYTSVFNLAKEIKDAVQVVCSNLKELSKEVTEEDTYKIALTSCNFDEEIAKTIQKAFNLSGKDGFVDLKPSNSSETSIQSNNGFILGSGFLSEEYLTSNSSAISLGNCDVFVIKSQVTSIDQVIDVIGDSTNCLVVAYGYTDRAMDELLVNRIRRKVNIIPVKIPTITSEKEDIAEDIRCYCDGNADEVLVTKYKTTIIKKEVKVDARISFIEGLLQECNDELLEDSLKSRISSLNGTSCVIQIGADSDVEYKEKLDRYDDALKAVKSSIEEGYVAGGGSTLHYIAEKNKKTLLSTLGGEIIYESLSIPAKVLFSNGNIEFNKFKDKMSKSYGRGVDLRSGKLVNLVDNYIIDPTKVTRKALESAGSVSAQLLATKRMIIL
jgi:chaperonin GroEL